MKARAQNGLGPMGKLALHPMIGDLLLGGLTLMGTSAVLARMISGGRTDRAKGVTA